MRFHCTVFNTAGTQLGVLNIPGIKGTLVTGATGEVTVKGFTDVCAAPVILRGVGYMTGLVGNTGAGMDTGTAAVGAMKTPCKTKKNTHTKKNI